MKKVLTFLLGVSLSMGTLAVNAQDLTIQAEAQTREMASKLNLNEGDFLKLKEINANRLNKIEALSKLREQDHRYLDLRLDQIEEAYNAQLFSLLKPAQYAAFVDYKKDQPYTYAGVTAKNNNNNAIAIQAGE